MFHRHEAPEFPRPRKRSLYGIGRCRDLTGHNNTDGHSWSCIRPTIIRGREVSHRACEPPKTTLHYHGNKLDRYHQEITIMKDEAVFGATAEDNDSVLIDQDFSTYIISFCLRQSASWLIRETRHPLSIFSPAGRKKSESSTSRLPPRRCVLMPISSGIYQSMDEATAFYCLAA